MLFKTTACETKMIKYVGKGAKIKVTVRTHYKTPRRNVEVQRPKRVITV